MLRERSQQTRKSIDEAMIADILLEYGPPAKVAAAYQPEKYLIGPRLFSSFKTVLQVLLPIVAVIILVNISIRLGHNPLSLEDCRPILSWQGSLDLAVTH